jgi:hypothetical protein
MQTATQSLGVLEQLMQDMQELKRDNAFLKQEFALNEMLLDELVWIPATRVLGWKIHGLKSWCGIHSAGLVVNETTRPYGISANSLKKYLRGIGYTPQAIKERIAA